MNPLLVLENGLRPFAVISASLETLDLFTQDDPIREEMMEIVSDARGDLMRHLDDLRAAFSSWSKGFPIDCEAFRTLVLDAMTCDSVPSSLNKLLTVTTSETPPASRFHFVLCAPIDKEAARQIPAQLFILWLVDDIRQSVQATDNYVDKVVFERKVFQKYNAFLFLCYAATNPENYPSHHAE